MSNLSDFIRNITKFTRPPKTTPGTHLYYAIKQSLVGVKHEQYYVKMPSSFASGLIISSTFVDLFPDDVKNVISKFNAIFIKSEILITRASTSDLISHHDQQVEKNIQKIIDKMAPHVPEVVYYRLYSNTDKENGLKFKVKENSVKYLDILAINHLIKNGKKVRVILSSSPIKSELLKKLHAFDRIDIDQIGIMIEDTEISSFITDNEFNKIDFIFPGSADLASKMSSLPRSKFTIENTLEDNVFIFINKLGDILNNNELDIILSKFMAEKKIKHKYRNRYKVVSPPDLCIKKS